MPWLLVDERDQETRARDPESYKYLPVPIVSLIALFT